VSVETKKKTYSFKIKNFEITPKEIEQASPSSNDTEEDINQIDSGSVSIRNQSETDLLHFEIKTTNYNMQTNISKIDESFVDYLAEAKIETKYGSLLSGLAGIPTASKNLMADQEQKQQLSKTNFMVYFDIALYEAPPVIIKLEERLAKQQLEEIKSHGI